VIGRTTIRFEHELLAGVELPCLEAAGRHDGPHVSLIGGIHGGEYSSIAAVIRVMRTLDASELRGRITAVPVVSMPSFRARSAFVVPVDSKNLNRCFPGSHDGTFSDVLARHVFDELIAPISGGSTNPSIGVYAKQDGVHLRIAADSSDGCADA